MKFNKQLNKMKTINSPFSDNILTVKTRLAQLSFRKESFEIVYHYFEDTLPNGELQEFTSTELDELNQIQVHNLYREKHRLPFPAEVLETRQKYGISASKMSDILGFGVNGYRQYEAGEVPSLSNGKLIQMAADPLKFRSLVEISDALEPKAKETLVQKIEKLLATEQTEEAELEHYLFNTDLPNEYTGYQKPNMQKLAHMVIYFAEKLKPWKTQLNKLLFYAEFQTFALTGFSMSGVKYRAIDMGPVPNNFSSIFEYMSNQNLVEIKSTSFENGGIGEQFLPKPENEFNKELFTEIELKVLANVAETLAQLKTQDLIARSHQEKAWTENYPTKGLISYKWGFEMGGGLG
jgi:transcriptional regulator with XRE-family HTH domain